MVVAQKLPPGRPSKLTPERAERLVELLAAGATTAQAAEALGVSRRTIQVWRARAWSRESRDAPYVALERRLRARSLHERRTPRVEAAEPEPEDWQSIAARLEREAPERWAAPDLDALLDGFSAP